MTAPDDRSWGGAQPAATAPSATVVRVKLFVHGGTVSFAMNWSGTLPQLQEHFTRNLQHKSAGIIIETPERLVNILKGSVSAYDFSREPLGSESALAEVRPA